MEARVIKAIVLLATLSSFGASHRTANFVVQAPTPEFAKQVGDLAEKYRKDLAIEWLGKEMPRWNQPCPIEVSAGEHLGAGGATSFVFDRGHVFGWQMEIQGSQKRILDSVLPHEVLHTVFATHFRQPLPRWADEGACTVVEHPEEKAKQQQMLIRFLQTGYGIAFSKLFVMKEYPEPVMPLYSQGFSLARFLINQGGKRKYVNYIGEGLQSNNWTATTKKFYSYKDLGALQDAWLDWVKQGSPDARPEQNPIKLAAVESDKARFQSPDTDVRNVTFAETISEGTAATEKATGNSPYAKSDSDWQPGAPVSDERTGISNASAARPSIYKQGSRGASIGSTSAAASQQTSAVESTLLQDRLLSPERVADVHPTAREASRQTLFEWRR